MLSTNLNLVEVVVLVGDVVVVVVVLVVAGLLVGGVGGYGDGVGGGLKI